MRILPLLLCGSAFLFHSSIAQQAPDSSTAGQSEPVTQNASGTQDTSLTQASATGIRFVLKTPMQLPETIYMPIDKNKLSKVELRPAIPGRRTIYPKNKKIALYSALDKGKPTNPIIIKELPANLSKKTLGVIGKDSNGKITLDFIDETALPFNCIYIQNLTGRTYTLELKKPYEGEPKTIELKPKSTYIFGKNSAGLPHSQTTPADVTYMTKVKSGKVVKVKERSMMLTTYPSRKVVMILSPDATGRTMQLSELLIYKERPVAPAKKD